MKFNKEFGITSAISSKVTFSTSLILLDRGRLKYGCHFTFNSAAGDVAITLVTMISVERSFAGKKHPYATHGPWLHKLVEGDFLETLINDLEEINKVATVNHN